MKTTIIIKVEKYRLDSSDEKVDNVNFISPNVDRTQCPIYIFCLVLYNFGHLMRTCNWFIHTYLIPICCVYDVACTILVLSLCNYM